MEDTDTPAPKEQSEKPSKAAKTAPAAATPAAATSASTPSAVAAPGGANTSMGLVAESQLQYLASLQGYKVTYSDFPKDGRFLR